MLIQNTKRKGPIFIGRDTPSLRARFLPLDSVSDTWTEDRVVYQLMLAIEALLESIRVPIQDLEELVEQSEDCMGRLPPSSVDRAKVLAKEVRLGNGSTTPLDDQDVQIALKLSYDLHLNELKCVNLLVAAHQEWILLGREPLEVLRLSEGLWFTERRALITTLQLLLRAVVLDDELDPDLVADIQQYVEKLLKAGLRRDLITLIKDLSREEPAGCGGPGVEQFVLDSRGSLVRRTNVSLRERLSLCQCLVFSCLIVRLEPQEMKEIYSLLKDCSHALNSCPENVKLQIAYTILFVIVIALMSDALSGTPEVPSILSINAAFHKEFQEQISENAGDDLAEGFSSIVRLTWAVFLMLTANARNQSALPPASSSVSSELGNASLMLDKACNSNAFKFMVEKVLKTPAFQNDDDDMVFMYCAYLHKMLTSLLSQTQGRDKVKTLRDSAMISLETFHYDLGYASMNDEEMVRQQRLQAQAQPFLSLLALITEVYQHEPELTVENDALWNFARFVSENHTNHVTLVAFLAMLTALGLQYPRQCRFDHLQRRETSHEQRSYDAKGKAHVVEQPPAFIGHRQPSTHGLVNGQDGNNEQAMHQTILMPMSNAGCFGSGSISEAMIRPSPALHGFMHDNAYGVMQASSSNPMYENIGVQPGFQCAGGSYGMPGANMGMAGFSQPYAQNSDMISKVDGNFNLGMPLLNAPA
ncbi:hypothetical protein L7F22_061081 [Adiantum nelumboides]|nr:hypothetical protein [Adiantum nelumboides]